MSSARRDMFKLQMCNVVYSS